MPESLQNTFFQPPEYMHFDLPLFLRALGLALALEGLCWAAFPEAMRRILSQLLSEGQNACRIIGLFSLGFGLMLAWLASLI